MKSLHLCALMAATLTLPAIGLAQGGDMSGGPEAGNITDQLATGLFLNPTAPGRDEGAFSAQYCLAALPVPGGMSEDGASLGKDTVVGHGALAVYGLTDRLEVGGQFLIAGPDPDNMAETFGGQLRFLVLDSESSFADVSVGGIFLFEDIERQTVYAAASKLIDCGDDGIFPIKTVTLHAGARQFWMNMPGGDMDDAVAYAGIETPIAEYVHFVTELSSKADGDAHQPYSFGFQVRRPDGFSCSLAAIQPGNTDGLGVFAGIGIPFN